MWTKLAPYLVDGHHAAALVYGATSVSSVVPAAFVLKTGLQDDHQRCNSRNRGRHVSNIHRPQQRVQRISPSESWRPAYRHGGCFMAVEGVGEGSRRRRRLLNSIGNLRAVSAGVGSSVGPRDSDLDETAPAEVQRPPSIRDEILQILQPDIPKVRRIPCRGVSEVGHGDMLSPHSHVFASHLRMT